MNRLILASFLLLAGCNTLLEAASPNDTTSGYRKETNSSGETVYRRERYIAPAYQPTPTPWPTPPPPPPVVIVEPAPLQDNNLVVRRAEPIQLTDTQRGSSFEPVESGPRTWALGGEISSDSKRSHFGFELFKKIDWLELKGGVSLFSADKDLYAGFDLGARPTFEVADNVALFGGVGLYFGDTKRCSYDSGVEACEKKFLTAGFVEAGVQLWNVSVFARSYNIEEAGKKIPSDTFIGVGVRTSY